MTRQTRLITNLKFIILVFLAAIIASSSTVQQSLALNGEYDKTFYSENNILFYNPSACSPSAGNSNITNSDDYSGKSILTAAQFTEIQKNKPVYESSAEKAGIPWQMLAAIHLRESGLKRYGPSNGYGPYQITPSTYKVGDYTDSEFQEATDKAADVIKNKSGGRDLTQDDNVKYTFFAYNGTAGAYVTQAKNIGLNADQANNGEGSPYVMNRADLIRDPESEPTKSNNTWGQIKQDGGSIEYPANLGYGAFVIYSALVGPSEICGGAGNGMNRDQATDLMSYYIDPANFDENMKLIKYPAEKSSGGPLANCVTFSAWFVEKYTTLIANYNNGVDVVGNMAKSNNLEVQTVPRQYAVFSIGESAYASSSAGHTGIVLGINQDNDEIIIGEEGYNLDLSWGLNNVKNVSKYKLSEWNKADFRYVYTDQAFNEEGAKLP